MRAVRQLPWVNEALAHYLDRHPLEADRITPKGAPVEDLLLVAAGEAAGNALPLARLLELPGHRLADPDSLEAARAALLVNYYSRVVSAGVLSSLSDLTLGLSGLTAEHLEALEPGFRTFTTRWAGLARRLHEAREALLQTLSRLRSAHSKFAEVTTAERHREEARLHALRQRGRRAPKGDEFLRDVPTRVSRTFQEAVGKTVVAQREVDLAISALYDDRLWSHMGTPPTQALEAVRSLRGDTEAAGGRAARYPRLRRAAADLRAAATHGVSRLEQSVGLLRLPPALQEDLRRTLAGPGCQGQYLASP
jgi:hypothetical protein